MNTLIEEFLFYDFNEMNLKNKGNEFILFFLIALLPSYMRNPSLEGTILRAKDDTENK